MVLVGSVLKKIKLFFHCIIYNAVLDACVKFGDKEKAVEWLSEAQEAGLKLETTSYNVVIDACAKSGDRRRLSSGYPRRR